MNNTKKILTTMEQRINNKIWLDMQKNTNRLCREPSITLNIKHSRNVCLWQPYTWTRLTDERIDRWTYTHTNSQTD